MSRHARRRAAAMQSGPADLGTLAAVGRIAFREEGSNWNAWYALPDTLDGALFLGSIRMAIVTRDPGRKAAFMALMREGVADIIEDKSGVRPIWPNPEGAPAPEHERTEE